MEQKKTGFFALAESFFLRGFLFCVAFYFLIVKTSYGVELFDNWILQIKQTNSTIGAICAFLASRDIFKIITRGKKTIEQLKSGEILGDDD